MSQKSPQMAGHATCTCARGPWIENGRQDTLRVDGRTVRILPVRPIDRLFGILRYTSVPVTIEEMERVVGDAACRDVACGDTACQE